MAEDKDAIRSALQADFEAGTDTTWGFKQAAAERERQQQPNSRGERDNMNNRDAIQHGLNAARQNAQEEGMTNQVEELANQLQGAGATNAAGAGAGATNAADAGAFATAGQDGATNATADAYYELGSGAAAGAGATNATNAAGARNAAENNNYADDANL